jgi:dephospho-CoA kinase
MRIAFAGKKGSGKTTAAQLLVEEHGFTKVSLATPIKEIAKLPEDLAKHGHHPASLEDALYGWTEELLPSQIYGTINPTYYEGDTPRERLVELWMADFEHAKSYRDLLQRIGTDSGRSIDDRIWIDHFCRHLPDGDLVIDDLRFVNEAEALERLSFRTVKLEVPRNLRATYLIRRDGSFDPTTEGHASETELDAIETDFTIVNTVTLDDFKAIVEQLAEVEVARVGT